MLDFLKKVPLFSGLAEEDLERLAAGAERVRLAAGEVLFTEGSPSDLIYLICKGSIEIRKSSGGQQVLLAVRRSGDLIGEMALLENVPRTASGVAATDSELMAFRREQLEALFRASPSMAQAMLQTMASRLKATELMLRQSEKMAQLGTLTAGIAHELNNPVAAVLRGTEQLGASSAELREIRLQLALSGLVPPQVEELRRLGRLAMERADRPAVEDSLTCADREEELEEWLEDRGLPQSGARAAELVRLGLGPAELEELSRTFPGEKLALLIDWVAVDYQVEVLRNEILAGARQIAEVARALKIYTHLDQAPQQWVDLHEGLGTTLTIMRGKLKNGVRVRREFAPGLPRVQAFAGELNQVWTNLIDNAVDAMDGRGELVLRTRQEDGWVVVEVEDNGPGIPPELQPRLFDPFFTTKPMGKGTGLGLHVSYNIVQKHAGRISFRSQPGKTVFEVRLPLDARQSDPGATSPPG